MGRPAALEGVGRFGDLARGTQRHPPAAFRSFNTQGVDWQGRFRPAGGRAAGPVQALWMGVQVPRSAAPGVYTAR